MGENPLKRGRRAFRFSRTTCFAACGGEVAREVARTPRAPAEGLAALLHHLHFQHHGKTKKPLRGRRIPLAFRQGLAALPFALAFYSIPCYTVWHGRATYQTCHV